QRSQARQHNCSFFFHKDVFMTRIAVILLTVGVSLFADTITLKNGSTRQGAYLGTSGTAILFEENGIQNQYDMALVEVIQLDSALPRSTLYKAPSTGRTASYADRGVTGALMIPVGAEIMVRPNEPIVAKSATLGRYYPATVEHDVTNKAGQVIIPRG